MHLLIVATLALLFLSALLLYACCVVGGRISRAEERRERERNDG